MARFRPQIAGLRPDPSWSIVVAGHGDEWHLDLTRHRPASGWLRVRLEGLHGEIQGDGDRKTVRLTEGHQPLSVSVTGDQEDPDLPTAVSQAAEILRDLFNGPIVFEAIEESGA